MHAKGLRPPRSRSMLAISHSLVLPSAHWNSVGALISDHFHGSIPYLHVPLSTLHVQPCDYPRMIRDQVDSLRLTSTTLAFGHLWRNFLVVACPWPSQRTRGRIWRASARVGRGAEVPDTLGNRVSGGAVSVES